MKGLLFCYECDNNNIRVSTVKQGIFRFKRVRCKQCGNETDYYTSAEDAIKEWNTTNALKAQPGNPPINSFTE